MADGSLDKSKQPERSWTPYLLVALVAAFGLWYFVAPHDPPFRNPHIKAVPFVWPKGCVAKEYKKFDPISVNCALEKNRVKEAQSYGFRWGAVGGTRGAPAEYYRLENNAVQIECRYQVWEKLKKCVAGTNYYNVFVVENFTLKDKYNGM
jgi:hypothetical protein